MQIVTVWVISQMILCSFIRLPWKIDWCLVFFCGRPFGGTAILVRSVFANKVSAIDTHDSRITAVRVCNSGQANMVFCSVYMPWTDRGV